MKLETYCNNERPVNAKIGNMSINQFLWDLFITRSTNLGHKRREERKSDNANMVHQLI
jgi:hypothetical protein